MYVWIVVCVVICDVVVVCGFMKDIGYFIGIFGNEDVWVGVLIGSVVDYG